MMIVDSEIYITVGARNSLNVRKYFPDAKLNSSLLVSVDFAIESQVSKKALVKCKCDNCEIFYFRNCERLKSSEMAKKLCSECSAKHFGCIQMKKLNKARTPEDRSKSVKLYFSTEEGKKSTKLRSEKFKNWLKTEDGKKHLDKCKARLPRKRGSDHPNYNPDMGALDRYKVECSKITNLFFDDLQLLENYSKRSLAGTEGGYHLDHRISLKFGYDNGIPPELVGHIENLIMIPWSENISKKDKCSLSVSELIEKVLIHLEKNPHFKRWIPDNYDVSSFKPKKLVKNTNIAKNRTGIKFYNDGENIYCYTLLDIEKMPFKDFLNNHPEYKAGTIKPKGRGNSGRKIVNNGTTNVSLLNNEVEDFLKNNSDYTVGMLRINKKSKNGLE
jgi:hypothetical protein